MLKICTKCGTKSISEHSLFCNQCGAKLPSDCLEKKDLPVQLFKGNLPKMNFGSRIRNAITDAMNIDYLSVKSDLNRIGLALTTPLAKYFPLLIFLCIILGFSAAFILNKSDYAVRGLVIGVPALLASYALIKIHDKGKLDSDLIFFDTKKYFITGLFIALYLLSISSVIISPTRPWFYFVLIAVLFCIVGVQIFSNNRNQNLILLEIVAVMINLAYGVVLKYPYYFGWTDTPYLIGLSQVTLLSGHSIPPDLELSYANFPLYHIYLAEIAATLGLDIQTVLFIVMIIPYAIATIFIFKLFYEISNNKQLSLLLCLVYACLSVIIFYGTYIQTRVMAYTGFIILLYIIFKDAGAVKYKLSYMVIFFSALVYLILVHQVSIFQMLTILVLLFVIEFIFSNRTMIRPDHLALIFVLTFSYWIYVASGYFREVFNRITIFESRDLLMIKPSVQDVNQWDFVLTNIDTAILVFFILCGIGYLLYTGRKSYGVVFALFGIIMLPFFVPNPLQLLWTNMTFFRSDRMMLYLAPFFAFLMALGVHVFLNYTEKRNIPKKISGVLLILIIFFFAIFSITLTNASDSKDIPWANLIQRHYFNAEEIHGFTYSINYIPYGSFLNSDYPVLRYFGVYKNFSKSDELGFPHYKTSNLNYSGKFINGTGYMIIREGEFQNNGLMFESNISSHYLKLPFNPENQAKINSTLTFTDVLFDNGDVMIAYPQRQI